MQDRIPTDFAPVAPDGSLIKFGNEPFYSVAQAKDRLKELLGDMGNTTEEDVVENCMKANPPFMFNSTIVLWNGFKSTEDEVKDSELTIDTGNSV